jgi:hypothetical protein
VTGMEVEGEDDGYEADGDEEEQLQHRESLGPTGGVSSPPAKPVPPYSEKETPDSQGNDTGPGACNCRTLRDAGTGRGSRL